MFDEEVELHIKVISIDWDKIDRRSYLRGIESIAGVSNLSFHKAITFFVGENGSGKSTLLEAIAVAYGFNPEGGTKNYSFSTYDSHSELCNAIRLIRGYNKPGWGYFLRAESFYNVASAEEVYSREGGRQPEAALSPQRQLTLLLEIVGCAQDHSQFIIVTHSPILLGIPGAEILSFDEGQIHQCTYEETDSYQVTEMFINSREQILKRLLES